MILSCACSAAAAALVVLFAPRRDWGDVLPEYPPPSGGTVIVYTLLNAIVVLVLQTPILLALKWATRDRLRLSPRAWGALGLTIPMAAYLAIVVPDFVQQWAYLLDGTGSWKHFWQLAWRGILSPEVLAFGPTMPTMTGGAAFGWLLFRPGSTPREPVPSPQ